jgi:hypothetical protein
VVELFNEPDAAVITVTPSPLLVANPVLLIDATLDCEDVHVAEDVRFCVLPSLKVPVATNCSAPPCAIEGLAGVTATELRVGGEGVAGEEGLAPQPVRHTRNRRAMRD